MHHFEKKTSKSIICQHLFGIQLAAAAPVLCFKPAVNRQPGFKNLIVFSWNSKFSKKTKIFKKCPPYENLESDGNRNNIITWRPYSIEMKLQYTKLIFNRVEFHIMMVFSNKNIHKQVRVINKLGWLGTGVPLAPVCQRAVNRQPGSRSNNS